LDGIHGGIDFGTGAWLGFLSQAGLSKAGSLSSPPGVFTLPAGKVLRAIRISSPFLGAWKISDGVNPERSGSFHVIDTPDLVGTDWEKAAATIRVEMDGFIDDIVYSDPPSTIAPLRFSEIRADAATGDVTLRWEGGADRFQVLKATSLEGPFLPASGLL